MLDKNTDTAQQLTILAAFAAYFSDMLAKHTSKGKSERAAQGLYNGDIPFGYCSTGPKSPPEFDPKEYPGLRMIGEMRMQGKTAEQIADAVNAAGYRTGSKRFGDRLFTIDTINAMTRCEFYAAYEPGEDKGTVVYKDQRFRGQHPAAFTYEEWQRIRVGSRANYDAPHRSEAAQRSYEFAGYISCVHCGLNLRARGGNSAQNYYKDMAKARAIPCSAGGYLQVRTDLVARQFGELLQSLRLPPYWRDMVREKMLEAAQKKGLDIDAIEREKERLKLKRGRILKQHREGYIEDDEFQGEMATVELALRTLEAPEMDGLRLDEVISAGERLPGMAALWSVASVEERRDMVTLILDLGGLHYDVELKEIAALTPRPEFLPVLQLLEGVTEYKEATGTIVTSQWRRRNRRVSVSLSPILFLFQSPSGKLYLKLQNIGILADHERYDDFPRSKKQRRPGPDKPKYGIPREQWPEIVKQVEANGKSLRKVAGEYNVSYETVRRILRAVHKQKKE